MAVSATGSKYSRNNGYIIAVACLAFAAWFAYDGYINEEYRQKHTREDGTPDANLKFNQYAPFVLVVGAVYFFVSAGRVMKRKITADDEGLILENGQKVAYDAITKIDKRYFDKEGHFTVYYQADGGEQQVKLSDRKFDNMGALLDELIRKTGAEPMDEEGSGEAKDQA